MIVTEDHGDHTEDWQHWLGPHGPDDDWDSDREPESQIDGDEDGHMEWKHIVDDGTHDSPHMAPMTILEAQI